MYYHSIVLIHLLRLAVLCGLVGGGCLGSGLGTTVGVAHEHPAAKSQRMCDTVGTARTLR
jgi:hypothetical protein